jgi:hypothetical protein
MLLIGHPGDCFGCLGVVAGFQDPCGRCFGDFDLFAQSITLFLNGNPASKEIDGCKLVALDWNRLSKYRKPATFR